MDALTDFFVDSLTTFEFVFLQITKFLWDTIGIVDLYFIILVWKNKEMQFDHTWPSCGGNGEFR